MHPDLKQALEAFGVEFEQALEDLIPLRDASRVGEHRLSRAMRYACLDGGKRLRPFLTCTVADLFGVSHDAALQTAVAIELIHTFSLVHDDLPAMDDDDLRRGRASTHKEFDEATAILAGDALSAYAFEILADESTHADAKVRVELVSALAKATGQHGMVGGQMMDMLSEERELNIEEITRLQRMKTGALFAVACEAGAILGKAPRLLRNKLRGYAHDIGLAFQITDDLLDAQAGENDNRENKSEEKGTFISVMGEAQAKRQADILISQAKQHVESFGKKALLLQHLADFIYKRSF